MEYWLNIFESYPERSREEEVRGRASISCNHPARPVWRDVLRQEFSDYWAKR